jgi:hypothetical protein
MQIKIVGLDIAKQVFQVRAADIKGRSCCTGQTAPRSGTRSLPLITAVPCRHGSVRDRAPLGTRTDGAWLQRAPDAARLREVPCQAQ